MSLEEAFAKVVGRQASEAERARLYRLHDALGLHDNDAFWSIVMALERYDAFFRQYPAELRGCARKSNADALDFSLIREIATTAGDPRQHLAGARSRRWYPDRFAQRSASGGVRRTRNGKNEDGKSYTDLERDGHENGHAGALREAHRFTRPGDRPCRAGGVR
jgi:hypothetical protein